MKFLEDSWAQLSRIWVAVLITLALGGLILFGVVQLSQATGHPLSRLTRDPAAIIRFPLYIGILSNIGIIFWSGTVGVCLFAALSLRGAGTQRRSLFFLCSGLLGLFLTLDDLFLLHEDLIPGTLGIGEEGYALGYGIVIVAFLLIFWRSILASDYFVLLLSMAMFGLSMIIDTSLKMTERTNFIEDGLKFLGILMWALYFTRSAHSTLRFRESSKPRARPKRS
jgi:hypothetical protein